MNQKLINICKSYNIYNNLHCRLKIENFAEVLHFLLPNAAVRIEWVRRWSKKPDINDAIFIKLFQML